MGVQGLTIRHVKSHLQNYRRQQKQSATKRQEEISIHDYGSSSIQTEVGTSQPVNPVQAAAGLGGQFVEPAITPCNGTQNWNSTLTPMPTYQGDNFSNPPFPQNEKSLLVDEEMHLLISSAAEEQLSNSMMGVAGSTQERAPSLGSSTNLVLQIPEEITASDETFLDLDDWPS
ncbi:uncharacterized protein LOC126409907 [Nymphaea colorata]|uniref:uncharacterized protein LOC126409907 n=1 Tax=Nymphaea colorata TaxID=210225 RepID=UPI00214E0F52|nr:uncharacterized protein LOC126409907 [Nymphaea colorata]